MSKYKKLETGLEYGSALNTKFCASQLEACIIEAKKYKKGLVEITETEALYALEILRRHVQMHGVMEHGTKAELVTDENKHRVMSLFDLQIGEEYYIKSEKSNCGIRKCKLDGIELYKDNEGMYWSKGSGWTVKQEALYDWIDEREGKAFGFKNHTYGKTWIAYEVGDTDD